MSKLGLHTYIKFAVLHMNIKIEVPTPFIGMFCKHKSKLFEPPLTVKQLRTVNNVNVRCERCNKKFLIANNRKESNER